MDVSAQFGAVHRVEVIYSIKNSLCIVVTIYISCFNGIDEWFFSTTSITTAVNVGTI